MKPYLYCLILLILSILLITVAPFAIALGDKYITTSKIPVNNSKIAGVYKYYIPPISKGILPPDTSARSIIVKDVDTDTILFQKNTSQKLPIASTTKIMTALVSSEYFQPNSILEVSEAAKAIGAKVGLRQGEKLSFRSLLYAMLLNSGNDAAYTIAENYPGGVSGFIQEMNQKASMLKLKNTSFDNPAGFDSPNHFSSASDLSVITQEAIKNSQLARIFATKDTQIISLDKKYQHNLHNLNKLLSQVKGVLGVKTGYTEAAKENLVTLVDRDGHKILTVLLGSDDRFGESTKLIEWVYQNYLWP